MMTHYTHIQHLANAHTGIQTISSSLDGLYFVLNMRGGTVNLSISSSPPVATGVQENATSAPGRKFGLILVLGVLSALGPFSLDMYLPALPNMASQLHSSTSAIQLSLTACMLGLALGQLFVGPLSDARGRRGPLLVALLLYTLTSVLCAISPNVTMFVIMRFIQGLAGAAGIVISRAIVRDMYSGEQMTRFFSKLMLINGAAPIIAPVLGGQFLRFASWRGVFTFLFVLGIILFIAVLLILPETLPHSRRHKGGLATSLSSFKEFISDPLFSGIVLSMGLVAAGMFSYISGSSFILQNVFGVSAQGYSLIFAVNGVGIIVAAQIAGRLVGKISTSRIFTFGIGIAVTGGTALLLSTLLHAGLAWVLISLFLVVSSVGVVSTTASSLALQNAGNAAGSASALIGLLQFVFGALASPLVGLGGGTTALPMSIVICAAELLAILFYLLLVRGRSHKL